MLVVFAMRGSLLGPDQEEKCATCVLWNFRGERKIITLLDQLVMVPRGGIEPPTRGFSINVL